MPAARPTPDRRPARPRGPALARACFRNAGRCCRPRRWRWPRRRWPCPSPPQSGANRRFSAADACCTASMVAPASAVTVQRSGSTDNTRFMRLIDSTIDGCRAPRWSALASSPPAGPAEAAGTAPPDMPVLPPWGTMATPAETHARTTRAVSSTEAGRTTARASPVNKPRWPVRYGAASALVRTPAGPRSERRPATNVIGRPP